MCAYKGGKGRKRRRFSSLRRSGDGFFGRFGVQERRPRRSHVVAAVVFLERTRRQGEKKNLTGNGKLAIINRHSEMQSSCTGGGKRKNLTENRLCGIIGKAFMRK